MLKELTKYRILFIVSLLILCSIFVESPYHSDYYGEPPFPFYFLITLINLLIYLNPNQKLIFIEKLIYSILVSCIVLISSGFFIEQILSLIYGYDSNWGELKSPPLLDNTLFYFTSTFSGIGIFKIWLNRKNNVYE